MRVLVACEFSGVVRDAFMARGHDAVSCDLSPTRRPGPHIQDDVLFHLNDGWDLMVAHPPCTYLTISGNKWMKPEYESRFPGRAQKRLDAAAFFMALYNAPIPRIAEENPIGVMSTLFRRPDQVIQPWQFGHPETKATCLWLKGLPKLHPTKIVPLPLAEKDRMRLHYLPRTPDRALIRSITFQGVADAMAEQWG